MVLRNHTRVFRPLRGGVYIFNPAAAEPGTLGLVVTSDGVDRWIISCYHVMGRNDLSDAVDGEPIFQPSSGGGPDGLPVALLDMARSSPLKDFAVAKCVFGIEAVSEVLGLGPLSPVTPPKINMLVVKSGIATGVTEGMIKSIKGDDVTIAPNGSFPKDYVLTDSGDSGAAWIEKSTLAPVAMNIGLVPSGNAKAVNLFNCLNVAGLSLPK